MPYIVSHPNPQDIEPKIVEKMKESLSECSKGLRDSAGTHYRDLFDKLRRE